MSNNKLAHNKISKIIKFQLLPQSNIRQIKLYLYWIHIQQISLNILFNINIDLLCLKFNKQEKLLKNQQKKNIKQEKLEQAQRVSLNSYRKQLQEKLYQVYPTIFSQISDHLKTKISIKHSNNYIMNAINVYSSIMGSYQLKLSIFDRLMPNLKSLSEFQWEVNHQNYENDFMRKIMMVLFVFFFAYVMIFKKYITEMEKNELIQLIKIKFVQSLSIIVQNAYEYKEENTQTFDKKVDQWIEQIKINKK